MVGKAAWIGHASSQSHGTTIDTGSPGKTTLVERANAPAKPQVSFDEAVVVMDAIAQLLEADGSPFVVTDDAGLARSTRLPPCAAQVPGRWHPLLQDWWMTIVGRVKHPSGMTVSYEGDMRAAHIAMAEAQTAPLVAAMLAEGDASTKPWLAANYEAPVQQLRMRAAQEAVASSIDKTAEKHAGGALDLDAMTEVDQLTVLSTSAIKTLRATMTVATRIASAKANSAKELDTLFAQALGAKDVPKSVEAVRAADLNTALGLAQGGVYTIQSILSIADPKKRYEQYREQWARFGTVAGSTEVLKDLGVALGGITAVVGAAGFAIAKVAGKSDFAAKAAQVGASASTHLGRINIALNALGVIHGIAVLCDADATPLEKAEAGIEVASGALGLAGRFLPAISPITAAMSTSLLVNFHAFKNVLEAGLESYAGMVALGLNICYADLKRTGDAISTSATSYAGALDLAGTFDEPLKLAALAEQTEAHRWNLVELLIKPFLDRATTAMGAGNMDPGTYSTLRRRFSALGNPRLETPEQIVGFTQKLLAAIVKCFVEAQDIYVTEVRERWARRTPTP